MRHFYILLLLTFLLSSAHAQLKLDGETWGPKPIIEGLEIPWSMVWAGEDSIMFTELGGNINLLDTKSGHKIVLHQFSGLARENQSGLMGLAIDNNFSSNKYVYCVYTYYGASNDIFLRIARLDLQGQKLVNEISLLDGIPSSPTNTGCRLLIKGNHMYFTLGDIKDRDLAQDTLSPNGKIHRILLDGSIPSDNPYPNSSIWSIGHRNPQGLCTFENLIVSSEHGAATNDELNRIEKKGNYGWPWVAGYCNSGNKDTCELFGIRNPMMAWSPTIAPAGIASYLGVINDLDSSILIACLKDQSLRSVKLNSNKDSVINEEVYMEGLIGRIRDVLVSPDGRIFLASSNEDVYGTPRTGGDKIFELQKGFVYIPPDSGIDTNSSDSIRLDSTTLKIRVVADHLNLPWDLHMARDGWIWFSQRDGSIKKLNPENGEIIDVHKIGEVFESFDNSGLHALALHPNFPIVPYVFVNYTYREYAARIVRYTYSVSQNKMIDSLYLVERLSASYTHNGSRIVFEDDEHFFIAIGDALRGDNPQQIQDFNGKICRMTIDGKIPEDNPYPGEFTWTYGHRNPQGLVIAGNGKMYSSEHGEATDDELNLIEKGRNYGWPYVEGFCDLPSEKTWCEDLNIAEPLTVWTPTEAPCGLDYFDHPSIPEWRNSLLQTFLKDKELKVLKLSQHGEEITSEEDYLSRQNVEGKNIGYFGRLRDVMVAPNGKIYLATSNREPNGESVVQDDDDKIIEIYNPNWSYVAHDINRIGSAKLFPNPVQNNFSIRLKELGQHKITIYNQHGQLVGTYSINTSKSGEFYDFKRASHGSGIHIIHVEKPSGSVEILKAIFL